MRTEEACELAFRRKGPYWHLYTPGDLTEIIFTCEEEFLIGMNLVAVCLAYFPGLRIVTFTLMNNHFHFILAGSREDVVDFFAMYRKRLNSHHFRCSSLLPCIMGRYTPVGCLPGSGAPVWS